MRCKYRIKEAVRFSSFAFYPKNTLITCFVFSLIIIATLVYAMISIPQESNWYNVVFALTTGAVSSAIVSFVVELTSNYRHNKLAWYELNDYYSAIERYERRKQIKILNSSYQRIEKKALEELNAAGDIDEIDKDEPKDVIQITWEELPKLIPILRDTINNKKEFLSDEEIKGIRIILSECEHIKYGVHNYILFSSMTHDALNHPDEEYLKTLYPADVLKNMPDWMRKHLSSEGSLKACRMLVDTILSDSFLLSQVMKDYDVSQKGLDNYHKEKNVEEGLKNTDETEESEHQEKYEPEDEDFRPYISWLLSYSCQNISESIDSIEKIILKKPLYGMMIERDRNLAKKSPNGILGNNNNEGKRKN